MPRVERSIVIDCKPEQVLAIVCDYEKYPEFLPEVKKCTVLRKDGAVLEVEHEVEVVKRIKYVLRHVIEGTNMRWSLVKGDIMKKNDGGWELKATPDGKTHTTYWLDIAFSIPFIPSSITDAVTSKNLPAVLENVKKRAEKLHPKGAA